MFIFFQFSNINSIRMYFSPNKIQVFFVRTFDKQIQYHNHQHQCDLEHLHSGKESTCQWGRPRFDPWFRRIPWNRKWQPTPVFLPEKFHGQRSLVDYSPWSHKELDMTNDTHKVPLGHSAAFPSRKSSPFDKLRSSSCFQSLQLCLLRLHE